MFRWNAWKNVSFDVTFVFVSGTFSFYSQPKSHGASTITEFIEKAMEHSRSGKFLYFLRPRAAGKRVFHSLRICQNALLKTNSMRIFLGMPPAPVQLLHPVSRFRTMQTLQHCCRFEILKHARRDHIQLLPVPQKIKDYLEESQYYVENMWNGLIMHECCI